VEVENAEDFSELISEAVLPVLVDFWATWCGPCRIMAPELQKLAKRRSGELIVAKVDSDKLSDVAGDHGISAIPTLVLFRSGREAKRISGAMPASAMERTLGL
jgi:thioredoxin